MFAWVLDLKIDKLYFMYQATVYIKAHYAVLNSEHTKRHFLYISNFIISTFIIIIILNSFGGKDGHSQFTSKTGK